MLSEDQRRQVQELILAYIGSAVVPSVGLWTSSDRSHSPPLRRV